MSRTPRTAAAREERSYPRRLILPLVSLVVAAEVSPSFASSQATPTPTRAALRAGSALVATATSEAAARTATAFAAAHTATHAAAVFTATAQSVVWTATAQARPRETSDAKPSGPSAGGRATSSPSRNVAPGALSAGATHAVPSGGGILFLCPSCRKQDRFPRRFERAGAAPANAYSCARCGTDTTAYLESPVKRRLAGTQRSVHGRRLALGIVLAAAAPAAGGATLVAAPDDHALAISAAALLAVAGVVTIVGAVGPPEDVWEARKE